MSVEREDAASDSLLAFVSNAANDRDLIELGVLISDRDEIEAVRPLIWRVSPPWTERRDRVLGRLVGLSVSEAAELADRNAAGHELARTERVLVPTFF